MVEKTRHSLYINIATLVAQESHARRRKVGSIIVKDGRIISMGWNGMPAGWDNNCEIMEYPASNPGGWLSAEDIEYLWPLEDDSGTRYKLVTRSEVLHAESNAIAKLAKSTESGENAELYITLSPCLDCAKLILQTGIKNVYYKDKYRDDTGIVFLEKSGIKVTQL